MRTSSQRYTFPSLYSGVMSDDGSLRLPALFCDISASTSRKNSMQEYFDKSYDIFLLRIKNFKEQKHPVTIQEEKELTFMLDALISAKSIITHQQ